MIRLNKVSKIYYRNGIVATGFNKVSTEFNMGEFVVIVGESGSGKSTLLNVISGLDSYEEGEMYINGEETSHYSEEDFEEYRRKYIANIFQAFNLVNSYTVKQNIELVLLIHGYSKKKRKERMDYILNEVGLWKLRNRRVSKLSGGQKQRVAIARALAKDTPIIVADEPTGNLDQESANAIFKLLHEISKDKLVVVVTHNYEQVSEYATRVLKMHDGKLMEDKVIKKTAPVKNTEVSYHKKMSYLSKVKLAFRNCFNIIPKFALILAVFVVISLMLLSQYASLKQSEYDNFNNSAFYGFMDTDATRIVINKKDKSIISDEEINKLENNELVSKYVTNDYKLDVDYSLSFDKTGWWLSGSVARLSEFDLELVDGRMPENDSEIIISGSREDSEITDLNTYWLNEEGTSYSNSGVSKYKVVGYAYNTENDDYSIRFYLSDAIVEKEINSMKERYTAYKLDLGGYVVENQYESLVVISDKVPVGEVYYPESYDFNCKKYSCKNKTITIDAKDMYATKQIQLKMTKNFNENNFKKITGLSKDEFWSHTQTVFVNPKDAKNLVISEVYQMSVYAKDVDKLYDLSDYLENEGYNVYVVKDTGASEREFVKLFRFMTYAGILILIVVMFFVSYLVISLVLRSRNTYFAIIRILGGTVKVCKQLTNLELFINATISFLIILGFTYLCDIGIIQSEMLNRYVDYLGFAQYLTVYVILIILSQLISSKFARKVFKDSMITTYNMEV